MMCKFLPVQARDGTNQYEAGGSANKKINKNIRTPSTGH